MKKKGGKKQMSDNGHNIEISNPNKVLFPAIKLSKREVVNYYKKISKYMLPFMKDRPITMQRFPNGIKEDGFYMKNAPEYFPDFIDTVNVKKKEGGSYNLVICQTVDTLMYLANQACITPHIWLSTKEHINKPDKLIFDLDPSNESYKLVKKAALALKDVVERYNLKPFVMTTGSNGLHIVVPIKPEYSFDKVKDLADKLAKEVIQKSPKEFTFEQRKEKREDRVFIDTLRNAYGQTSVTPYALRTRKNAPVATPITWEELKNKPLDPRKYTIKNIFKRLSQIEDPWKEFHQSKQQLKDII